MPEVNYAHYRQSYGKARQILENHGYFQRRLVDFTLPGGGRASRVVLFDCEGQVVTGVASGTFSKLRRDGLLQRVMRGTDPAGETADVPTVRTSDDVIFTLAEGLEDGHWEQFKLRKFRDDKKALVRRRQSRSVERLRHEREQLLRQRDGDG